MHSPQFGITPIPDCVEAPGLKPCCRLFAPTGAPVSTEFALQISGKKIESATMIKRAPTLRRQAQAVIVLAPMLGQFPSARRQIVEHELAPVDIGRPAGPRGIHPNREEGIPVGGNK